MLKQAWTNLYHISILNAISRALRWKGNFKISSVFRGSKEKRESILESGKITDSLN